MRCITDFHHEVTNAVLPQTDRVFHDATPFDTTIDVLDAHTATRNRLIFSFLVGCEPLPAWLLGRHDDLDVGQDKGEQAEVSKQPILVG